MAMLRTQRVYHIERFTGHLIEYSARYIQCDRYAEKLALAGYACRLLAGAKLPSSFDFSIASNH